MPKSKKTPAQLRAEQNAEAARLQARSNLIKQKGAIADCNLALKAYPHHAISVVDYLTSLGVDWAQLQVKNEPAAATPEKGGWIAQPVGPPSANSASSAAGESSAGMDDSPGADKKCDPLPACYTEVSLLSAAVMMHYLGCCEPVAFSAHSLKALRPAGKKTRTEGDIAGDLGVRVRDAPRREDRGGVALAGRLPRPLDAGQLPTRALGAGLAAPAGLVQIRRV